MSWLLPEITAIERDPVARKTAFWGFVLFFFVIGATILAYAITYVGNVSDSLAAQEAQISASQRWITSRTKIVCRVAADRERAEIAGARSISQDAVLALSGTPHPTPAQREAVADLRRAMIARQAMSIQVRNETGC